MANNPVQIVLNTQNFVQPDMSLGGGGSKDFFAGKDESFRKHKDKLINDLTSIKNKLTADQQVINYAHVVLSNAAWAKSHRPTRKIFPANKFQHVGGGTIGEFFVELTAENINEVAASITKAEEETRWEDKNGKRIATPSRERSEVGGIQEIRLHLPTDRRGFSAQQAIDWLSDPRTGGIYIVQTFVTKRQVEARENKLHVNKVLKELDKFSKRIQGLKLPITVEETNSNWQSTQFFLVRIDLDVDQTSPEQILSAHQKLLTFLDSEPLVRRIILPPKIESTHTHNSSSSQKADISPPMAQKTYPVVGVIDTGIESIETLDPWVIGSSDFLNSELQDKAHGTFIGGLTAAAHTLNQCQYLQESACMIFDLGLFPTDVNEFGDYYPRGFIDFLDQLDIEIKKATAKGVRVFNMSLSIDERVQEDSYSIFAAMIDEISDRHGIIFVLPAGNLNQKLSRTPWPNEPENILKMLADYRYQGQDRILQPADSIRSISVAALDPLNTKGAFFPAQYTRRGPSTALGCKPDVAHIGGRFHENSGLFSLDVKGNLIEGCGTSYAAPLIAKTLATLNHIIEGEVPRETLIGLLIHNAETPEIFSNKSLSQIAKDFVGHGIPSSAINLLQTNDSTITLVLTGQIMGRHELVFPFTWPASLVGPNGACRGKAKMTLAYTPFTEQNFVSEYVRVNLDAYLRQEKIDPKTNKIQYVGFFKPDANSVHEKERIEHGQKWWPIKRRERTTSKQGVGQSSQWRLVVDALTREGEDMPEHGVPFSVILTIEDTDQKAPVFNEVRRTLQANGATISDIRTAQRVRPRV